MLRRLSQKLLDWGAAIVMLKLGDQGAYLRTTPEAQRIKLMGAAQPKHIAEWLDRELVVPCFQANVIGTTGSGDCTIAGLLAGLVSGRPADACLRTAVAVGAASVESADATTGVPSWRKIQSRIASGWKPSKTSIAL